VDLAFAVDKLTDYQSTICSWNPPRDGLRNTFGRQAIPMVWDYAEGNPFSNSSGCFDNMLEWITKCVEELPASTLGEAEQFDAQTDCGLREIMVSTDPPYYDNIGYADLSDYFYVWMRQSLKDVYPNLFSTMLVPKGEELIATPYRHEGSKEKAKVFFENGMLSACRQIYKYSQENIPVTIYYAYKQSDTSENGKSSSGWETMLSAIVRAGFSITGTWPMRTERSARTIGLGTNALASSIVLVCRKRPEDAPQTTRRTLISQLRRELHPALKKLQESNIAPVDLAQAAIGPGMGVFSRYSSVLEADGTEMTVRSALQVINEQVDAYFNEQVGSLDTESRFCVDLYLQNAYEDISFGDAEILSNAKGAHIPNMVNHGVLYAKAGKVHLVKREDLPQVVLLDETNIWLLTQQLTYAMETGGIEQCAKQAAALYGSNAEHAKDLAYRLYTVAEQKGWTSEAFAYNALVVSWPDIQSRAAELKAQQPEQLDLF
jgi:putative DNA methylase